MHKMAKIDDYIVEIAQQFPNPIVNDGGVNREMTQHEKEAWWKFSAERKIEAEKNAIDLLAQQAAKQALLDKLGLTAEEAKLLLS